MIPSLSKLLSTAMHAAVRRAVWSMPKKVFWAFFILIIVIAAIFGK